MKYTTIASALKYSLQKPITPQLVGDKTQALAAFKNLFPGISPEKVARASGAIDGSHVQFSAHHPNSLRVSSTLHSSDYDDNPDLDKNIRNALFYAIRTFHKTQSNEGPEIILQHHSQHTDPSIRGKGYERFNDQLKHLRDLGVHGIHIEQGAGAGLGTGVGSDGHTGYYTWPRFGFNGRLNESHLKQLTPELRTALGNNKDFHTLFSLPGGPERWKSHGFDTDDLFFNVDPNSEHSKKFEEYYQNRLKRDNEKRNK